MMALVLLSQAAEPPAAPADWAVLVPLPYVAPPRVTPQFTAFVASEIAANRCALPRRPTGITA